MGIRGAGGDGGMDPGEGKGSCDAVAKNEEPAPHPPPMKEWAMGAGCGPPPAKSGCRQ